MSEIAIEELTRIMIKEQFENKGNEKYIFTKNELIRFCIKLEKIINKVEQE